MKRVVLSGVNLVEMGGLVVYREALEAIAGYGGEEIEVVALVHRKDLLSVQGVRYIEYPAIKSSWLRRIKFEYFDLKKISKDLDADIWLSMHDITPNVSARFRAVYCHNPSPFYRLRLKDIWYDWKLGVFGLLYARLYRINMKLNDIVIVQQDWLRDEFRRRYWPKCIVVAHPTVTSEITYQAFTARGDGDQKFCFYYPAYPRVYKNFEVILEAVKRLEESSVGEFEVWLSPGPDTNKFSHDLVEQYRNLKSVRWLNMPARSEVFKRYQHADCLIFASKLETWGLPITEFKPSGRPIIAADLPYARETVGSYDQVAFFDPDNATQLAEIMKRAIAGDDIFQSVVARPIADPVASGWVELWKLILSADNGK